MNADVSALCELDGPANQRHQAILHLRPRVASPSPREICP